MPSQNELLEFIADQALMDVAKLDLSKTLDELGIDSVDFVSVLFALEEKYDIAIETEELDRDMKLEAMIALIQQKIAAQANQA